MKASLHLPLSIGVWALGLGAFAQERYLEEVFTPAQVQVTRNVTFATNIDFWLHAPSSPPTAQEVADITTLKTLAAQGQPYPAAFYDTQDPSTEMKVSELKMDIYEPDQSVDEETARPVVVYIHTGNLLPPVVNSSPTGTRTDSCAVEVCKRLARRGYVAVSVDYRLGWNPLGSTEQIRRGTLLNAVYRAIHDVKQGVRFLRDNVNGPNTYAIDPAKVMLWGEGTGGYIALAYATLDRPEEIFIEKFRPDPFTPNVSYVDTNIVGNIDGFGGMLNLYQPTATPAGVQLCLNQGGALADTSWLAAGDVPMIAFHTVFDPFAPFTSGVVIVPGPNLPVVTLQGSNLFIQRADQYGNNASFATLPGGDPFTDRARSLYGTTQTHGSNGVSIRPGNEGLFPFVTPQWPSPATEEAGPWQWWDPNSPVALATVPLSDPPITCDRAAKASNPNMSAAKALAYIDTIMGYANPRIVCALGLGPCSLVGIDESDPIAVGVEMYPNPAHDRVSITSAKATIRAYELYDMNGRRLRNENVERNSFTMPRGDLKPGVYFISLQFDKGSVTRKVVLD
ncbi:MAG: T9SS type A sorting domain-containing protein [Flavobacteriales bacterium]